MGIFDFFKKKDNAEPSPDEAPSLHYLFSHLALRTLAMEHPLEMLCLFADDKRDEVIDMVLADLVKEFECSADFSSGDIAVHQGRINDYPCAIIEMPEPGKITEVFFIALLVFVDPANLPEDPSTVKARYFTLERGVNMNGTSRTVFCEWADGQHSNFGDGPEPTIQAFADKIEEVIA